MSKTKDFLGPYRLARLIRVGSSCAVWEAIKDDNERYCLKVLRQDLRTNREEVGHLKHEFEVAKKLKHPNIIKIYDFQMEGRTPYLVLELYAEQNLKLALRKGHDQLAYYIPKIVKQSAEALYHLNESGWVHCDIKPDNILVSPEGDTKLIDFTIAERIKTGLSRMFGSSKKRGTRSYMSPEQIRGKALDARSDVYGFGCVLFEMLTGKPPYTANTPDELLMKHLKAGIPSVQVFNENVTPEGATLIKEMMAKKAEDRPANMWEFLKVFNSKKIFKKAPRLPKEKLVVDPTEYDDPEALFKKGAPEDEFDEDGESGAA